MSQARIRIVSARSSAGTAVRDVTEHGTMFVGFSSEQRPLATMLESMAGLAGGVRDALTRYTRPLTVAYYFVPSTESLRRVGAPHT
jgi:putative iron-dependent peroxidase